MLVRLAEAGRIENWGFKGGTLKRSPDKKKSYEN
jgi:hypothetical protein